MAPYSDHLDLFTDCCEPGKGSTPLFSRKYFGQVQGSLSQPALGEERNRTGLASFQGEGETRDLSGPCECDGARSSPSASSPTQVLRRPPKGSAAGAQRPHPRSARRGTVASAAATHTLANARAPPPPPLSLEEALRRRPARPSGLGGGDSPRGSPLYRRGSPEPFPPAACPARAPPRRHQSPAGLHNNPERGIHLPDKRSPYATVAVIGPACVT